VGEYNIVAVFFADDIVLIGANEKWLQQLLDMTTEFGQEWKLEQ